MTRTRHALCGALFSMLVVTQLGGPCAAEPDTNAEAGRHFQRGIALYNEADYRAALAELKRAYALSPASSVLYDIGQTEYQLKDYAQALVTFERYLAESGPAEAHRADVLAEMDVLHSRVGEVTVRTTLAGSDVLVDDVLVGRTPLPAAIVVSIGARKITLVASGHVPVTRVVEVAGGDRIPVTFDTTGADASVTRAERAPVDLHHKRIVDLSIAWGLAGGFGLVAVSTGAGALVTSHDLADARGRFPETQSHLDSLAHRTLGLSVAADVCTVVAVAAGVAGLVLALRRPRPVTHAAAVLVLTSAGYAVSF